MCSWLGFLEGGIVSIALRVVLVTLASERKMMSMETLAMEMMKAETTM